LASKIPRIVGSALMGAASLLCILTLRPSAKVPEPEPTPREATQSDAMRLPGATAPPGETVLASKVVPRLAASQAPPAGALRHPHPITPQHERIYRENQLTFSLDGAVDVEDAKGIRRLLATYRQEFPEDSLVLQQGYEIIADCLERPGIATRTVAQSFYDTEFASTLRRHVRRHCLEKP
jgi:hypothetical protein